MLNRHKIAVTAACLGSLMIGSAHAAYNVVNPTDIYVSGNSALGKDIIDPAGGLAVTQEYGNYSMASFNGNDDRYVLGMDTNEFATGAGNIPGDITFTEAVSGTDLTITMGTGVQFLLTSPTESTSQGNALALSNFSFRNLTFDRPVEAAGFVIAKIGQPGMTVSFYSDADGTDLLASYNIDDAATGERYSAFVGHRDTNVGIRSVSAVRSTSTGSATLIDDIAVVVSQVPEPGSMSLLSIAAMFLLKRRHQA